MISKWTIMFPTYPEKSLVDFSAKDAVINTSFYVNDSNIFIHGAIVV